MSIKARLEATKRWKMVEHFTCPVCHQGGNAANIDRESWFYCERCRVRRLEGENLLSSWRDETPADWERNRQFLSKLRVVED